MRANYLSKKETSKLVEEILSKPWGQVFMGKRPKQALELRDNNIRLYKIGAMIIVRLDDNLFPALLEEYNSEALRLLPSLIVDMGAVPYISRGADVMRPGVRRVEGMLRKGELLVVRDESHRKALAIAKSLVDQPEFMSMEKGKVAANLHYIGDKTWKLIERGRKILEQA